MPPNYAAAHHHPPPSTTTHPTPAKIYPPQLTTTHHQPKYIHHYSPQPTDIQNFFYKKSIYKNLHPLSDGKVSRGGSRIVATSKAELSVIIVNNFQPLTIITKSSTLDAAAVLDPLLVRNLTSRPAIAKKHFFPWPFPLFLYVNKKWFKKLQCEKIFILCETSLVLRKGKCLISV